MLGVIVKWLMDACFHFFEVNLEVLTLFYRAARSFLEKGSLRMSDLRDEVVSNYVFSLHACVLVILIIWIFIWLFSTPRALHHVEPPNREMQMVTMEREFKIQILNPLSASLNGIAVKFVGTGYRFNAFWGVSIYSLRELFALSLEEMIPAFDQFASQCVCEHPFTFQVRPETQELSVTFRCVENLVPTRMLGDRYPFVVILMSNNPTVLNGERANLDRFIIAECVIMNVDSSNRNGRIIDRWIKPYNGPAGSLLQIYDQGLPLNNDYVNCVVCCDRRVCAFFPCGHASVCSICALRITRCPICFKYYQSYFEY